MSKDARGKKRRCKSCGAMFYDLGKEPVVCATCGADLNDEKPAKVAAPKAKPKEKVVEAESEPEPEPKVEPKVEPKPAADEPEFISLEEAAAAETGKETLPDLDDEEAIADLDGDDGDEITSDDDDDIFLEPEVDGEPDVEGIIGSPIKPDD